MAQQKAEIEAIVNNPDAATFANTLEALDRAGAPYTRVSYVFNAVNGANTNDTLQEVDRILAPERAAHRDGRAAKVVGGDPQGFRPQRCRA
jgi:peptidyl-dipeptidase Dcp